MGQEQTVSELTGDEGGVWRVTTVGSSHVFDLNRGTVSRVPGPGRKASINDVERPIRSIEACRVGEVGRWTMLSDNYLTDYFWHRSSTVQSIERLTGMALLEANSEVAFQNIRAADGVYTASEVAGILDVDESTVTAMLNTGELIGFTWKEQTVFPGVQLDRDSNEVRPFVKPLIAEAKRFDYSLRGLSFWLYGRTTYLDGARPVDYIDRPELIVDTFRTGAAVEW